MAAGAGQDFKMPWKAARDRDSVASYNSSLPLGRRIGGLLFLGPAEG